MTTDRMVMMRSIEKKNPSTKRVNIPDVQNVLPSWILDKNELKSTIHFGKLYRVNGQLVLEQGH